MVLTNWWGEGSESEEQEYVKDYKKADGEVGPDMGPVGKGTKHHK